MKIRKHYDDCQLYELYTEQMMANGKMSVTVWSVIHEDGLQYLGLTTEDLENCDYDIGVL